MATTATSDRVLLLRCSKEEKISFMLTAKSVEDAKEEWQNIALERKVDVKEISAIEVTLEPQQLDALKRGEDVIGEDLGDAIQRIIDGAVFFSRALNEH